MADYTPITSLDNLTASQRAYELPTGEKVIVDIHTLTVPASAFNSTAASHLAIQISVWQINEDGTEKTGVGRPPVKNETILTSSLAEGTLDLADTLTTMTLASLDRMVNWIVVRAQIEALLAATGGE